MTWECMQMLLQNTVLDHSNHTKKFTVQMLTCWQLALGSVKYPVSYTHLTLPTIYSV